jgi:hypothetical protein
MDSISLSLRDEYGLFRVMTTSHPSTDESRGSSAAGLPDARVRQRISPRLFNMDNVFPISVDVGIGIVNLKVCELPPRFGYEDAGRWRNWRSTMQSVL